MTIDLTALWDFNQPAVSKQRFRSALVNASGDDALILQTQIARSYGLRGDFERSQQILQEIEAQVEHAGGEVCVRHALEWGRTLSSAAHSPESKTEPVQAAVRAAFLRAYAIAQDEQLDDLADVFNQGEGSSNGF